MSGLRENMNAIERLSSTIITATYGARCFEPSKGCPICDAWGAMDELVSQLEYGICCLEKDDPKYHWPNRQW